jgi:hypothetical protein
LKDLHDTIFSFNNFIKKMPKISIYVEGKVQEKSAVKISEEKNRGRKQKQETNKSEQKTADTELMKKVRLSVEECELK